MKRFEHRHCAYTHEQHLCSAHTVCFRIFAIHVVDPTLHPALRLCLGAAGIQMKATKSITGQNAGLCA